MHTLLISPEFVPSFFSLDEIAGFLGRKTTHVPLGLVTVAALLPQDWDLRVVDCNVNPVSQEDWDWADLVMISGMITQRWSQDELIREAKRQGKAVAVGGPFATSVPDSPLQSGADFLVLDEGEVTIPMFLQALERGESKGTFSAAGQQADMTMSPIPRFDLLKLEDYMECSVQFARGCPFLCEFCDIPMLFGRVPRAKKPEQVVAELDYLRQLGWDRAVMIADDNFIGNKKLAMELLAELKVWQEKNGYATTLSTEASLNIADDDKLLDAMLKAGFRTIFVGIESPDVDSLIGIKKKQNCKGPMIDRINKIYDYGFRIVAGMIMGFDGEKPGADRRIADFVQQASIPIVMVNMLSALPNTPLTKRLEQEQRIWFEDSSRGAAMPNFTLTRPLKEVIEEYVRCLKTIYDPSVFLDRAYDLCVISKKNNLRKRKKNLRSIKELKAAFILVYRQGFKYPSRFKFWSYCVKLLYKNPSLFRRFVSCCGEFEHFYAYSNKIEKRIWNEYEALGDEKYAVFTPSQSLVVAETSVTAKG